MYISIGARLDSEVDKYILRTDIMFERIAVPFGQNPKQYQDDPNFIKANYLYSKSIALQKAGDPKGRYLLSILSHLFIAIGCLPY